MGGGGGYNGAEQGDLGSMLYAEGSGRYTNVRVCVCKHICLYIYINGSVHFTTCK